MRLQFFATERKLAALTANANISWLAELLRGKNTAEEKICVFFFNLDNALLNTQMEQDMQNE